MDNFFAIWMMSQLPLIYFVFTGILLCWGIGIVSFLRLTIKKAQQNSYGVRKCDTLHFRVVTLLVFVNLVSVVLTPDTFFSRVDIMIVVNFWISLYYFYVTCVGLKHIPNMLLSHELRKAPNAGTE